MSDWRLHQAGVNSPRSHCGVTEQIQLLSIVRHSEAAFVQANGIELAYDTFGDASAAPLLLIMGLACQMIAWDDDFCSMLAARGHWVIRFDNRDVGLSTKLNQFGVPDISALFAQSIGGGRVRAPYTLRDMADDTVGLLDALGLASAHIVGASMGGAIAQLVAIHHGSRVRTLTSIMATSGAIDLPPPTPAAMAAVLTPTPTVREAYIERYRQTWKVLRGAGFDLDDERDFDRAVRQHIRGIHPAGAARQLAAIIASGSRKPQLASLGAPTLVIHGKEDPLVPMACGIDVARTVPGARQFLIEGMGHALPISMWPRIVGAITEHTGAPSDSPLHSA